MIPKKEVIDQEIEEYLQEILELIPYPQSYQIDIVQSMLRLIYVRAWISAQGTIAEEKLKKKKGNN